MEVARVFTPEFRVSVAERMLNGESVSVISNELKIERSVLYRWRDAYRNEGADGLNRSQGRPPRGSVTEPAAPNTRVAALRRIDRTFPTRRRAMSGTGAFLDIGPLDTSLHGISSWGSTQ